MKCSCTGLAVWSIDAVSEQCLSGRSRNIYTQVTYITFVIFSANVPTLPEFISFPMATGRVNLAERIGTRYTTFGILLLEDAHGDCIEAITREHSLRAEDINCHVFREWLKGRGRTPVSWATLVCVLQDMGLCGLAQDIEHSKCPAL